MREEGRSGGLEPYRRDDEEKKAKKGKKKERWSNMEFPPQKGNTPKNQVSDRMSESYSNQGPKESQMNGVDCPGPQDSSSGSTVRAKWGQSD